MKFHFEFTDLNYRVRHAAAVELGKIYPGSEFSARAEIGSVARDFLEKQADIVYKKIYDHRSHIEDFLAQKIDYDYLSRFEETLPEKSLWRILAVDASWNYQFVKGIVLQKSNVHRINTKENILKMAQGYIKLYEHIIADFKPDVLIPAAGQNSMSCPIIERVCKNHSVWQIYPETIRTQNYMALTDNRQCTFPQVNDLCRKLMDGIITMDTSKGEKCYEEMMSDLERTNYFDVSDISHLKSKMPILKFLYSSIRSIVGAAIKWQKEPEYVRKTVYHQPNNLTTFFHNIYYRILIHLRRLQLTNPEFYSAFIEREKYVYFPLHSPKEYSTQVQGTMWIDQLPVIEALAKSIPNDWVIVVKEHPGTLLWRVRESAFYKKIKEYPNVKLIPTDISSHKVIQHAQCVVTIIGTTGWEAVLRGVPVINFEENMYEAVGLSAHCSDFKDLSVVIHNEMKRMSRISKEERRRRIVCLLTAIIDRSFWVDDPLKVTGDAQCESEEEARKIGGIIAKSIKEYVETYDRDGLKELPFKSMKL